MLIRSSLGRRAEHPTFRLAAAAALLLSAHSFAFARPVSAQDVDIKWSEGPASVNVGGQSTIAVPVGCVFADAAGAKRFMELTENPASGNELGVLLCESEVDRDDNWFVVFSFDGSGYVRDNDSRELDADRILAAIRKGTEIGNAERRRRGWGTMTITRWVRSPHYDQRTNNLTWSLEGTTDDTPEPVVNHSVRLLGRDGVMHVDLVAGNDGIASAMPKFEGVVASHSFVQGRRYAEWREGDKVAAYGLTALVAGGAGAVAMKTGLFAKLWKLLIIPFVLFFGWVKSLFARKEQGSSRY